MRPRIRGMRAKRADGRLFDPGWHRAPAKNRSRRYNALEQCGLQEHNKPTEIRRLRSPVSIRRHPHLEQRGPYGLDGQFRRELLDPGMSIAGLEVADPVERSRAVLLHFSKTLVDMGVARSELGKSRCDLNVVVDCAINSRFTHHFIDEVRSDVFLG